MRTSLPAIFIFIGSFLSFQSLNAQLAIITDPDGFCNIRETPDIKSKVQDTLANGRLVYVLPEETLSNWLFIDYNKGEKYRSGCIHKSRIVYLNSMSAFKATIVNDTLLKLTMNDMQAIIKTGQFVKKGRKITFDKSSDYKIIETIDGRNVWGNNSLPTEEYKSIQFRSGTSTITFSKKWFNDLLSPNLLKTMAFLDKTNNTFYILADNGDASLSYTCIWILKNGQVEHREVFAPF